MLGARFSDPFARAGSGGSSRTFLHITEAERMARCVRLRGRFLWSQPTRRPSGQFVFRGRGAARHLPTAEPKEAFEDTSPTAQ